MSESPNLLATLVTMTTYGTWLPGDLQGYVDAGVVLPGNPALLNWSRQMLSADPVLLTDAEQEAMWIALLQAADEFDYVLQAASIERWHAHVLLSHGYDAVETVVGRVKTRMRQAISRGTVWGRGLRQAGTALTRNP